MLVKEHQFKLYVQPHVVSFVVEELIWSDRPWPHKYRLTAKSPNSREKTFYGPSPKELVYDAIRYISRQELSLVRSVFSLRQVQSRSGTDAD
jgi:hypothetical protein